MLDFSDLYNRLSVVLEGASTKGNRQAEVLPLDFQGVPAAMKAEGITAGQYNTIKYIAGILFKQDIITNKELYYITSSAGANGKPSIPEKQKRLLELMNDRSEQISNKGQAIRDSVNKHLDTYLKGHDLYGDRLDPRFGNIGATKEKRLRYKEKEAEKQKVKEMKRGAKTLAAAANIPAVANVINQVVDAADAAEKNIDDEKVGVSTQKVGTMALINKAVEKLMTNLKANIGDGPDKINIDLDLIEKVEAYIERNITTLKGLRELTLKLSNMPGHQYKLLANYLQFEVTDRIKDIVKQLKPTYNTADKVEDEEKVSDEPYAESTTYHYLSEQIKKDTHTHRSTEVSVSFREKYKPKTHWQLAELRRYGM